MSVTSRLWEWCGEDLEQNFNEPLEDFQQGLGRVCLTLMCVYISLFLQSKINTDNIYQN